MENRKYKDTVALVISLVFIVGLAFFGYRYFIDTNTVLFNQDTNETPANDDDILANQTNINDAGSVQNDQPVQTTFNQYGTTETPVMPVQWVANDYNQGDITAGTYTVQEGDTLWEIAEGVYGNGADWVKILNANAQNVDFLANGQQALIFSGQVLVIPAI